MDLRVVLVIGGFAAALIGCGSSPTEQTGSQSEDPLCISQDSEGIHMNSLCGGTTGGGGGSTSSSGGTPSSCPPPPNACYRDHRTDYPWGYLNGATACGQALLARGCQGSFGSYKLGYFSQTPDVTHTWYAVACPAGMAMPSSCRVAPFNCDTGMMNSDLQYCLNGQSNIIGSPPDG